MSTTRLKKRRQKNGERKGEAKYILIVTTEEVKTSLLKKKFESMGEHKMDAYLAKKRKRKEQKSKVSKPYKRRHTD
jgi:hypothetical protein